MKKFLAIAFALIFVCCSAVSIAAVANDASETVESPAKGDINANGKIDMTDYILTKRAYFNTYALSEEQNYRADLNDNAKLDMTDYILLKRIYFGTYTYGATIDEATPDSVPAE